jgi:hypothetical protein
MRRRPADRRLLGAVEVLRLEERCMLSDIAANQIPPDQVTAKVDLDTIIWNGGPPLNTATGITLEGGTKNVPSPSKDNAMKTITLTNNSPHMIYPYIWEANTGKDPNAKPPIPPNTLAYYDPQDLNPSAPGVTPDGYDFRVYVGYSNPAGTFIGLPKGASITFQLPLVFWNGGNFVISTDPRGLNENTTLYHYDANAKISIAGTTASGTTPENTTTWVTNNSGYPTADKPVVVFYFDKIKPPGVSLAAPAQLLELTFRDPYLKQFFNDNLQSYPLINYDVSYVDKLTTPVALEAGGVPVVNRIVNDPKQHPATYYAPPENFGWNAANQSSTAWYPLLQDFINNKGGAKLGGYFGGKGWPKFYNDKPTALSTVIPAGASLFAYSPLSDARSPYDQNHYLLTSNSIPGPVQIVLGAALIDGTNIIKIAPPQPDMKLFDQLVKRMQVFNTGDSHLIQPHTAIKDVGIKNGRPFIELDKTPGKGDNSSGYTILFKTPIDDYAVNDITQLWYSWADYYVTKVFKNYPTDVNASATYIPPTAEAPAANGFTLNSAPKRPLLVGMTVKGQDWIRKGTTILRITNAAGDPIASASAKGDIIYLSRLPVSTPTAGVQSYIFGKPPAIPYTDLAKPYDLTFPDTDQTANLFAGSVYAALSAEAEVINPPPTNLPKSADVVARVIQFDVNLPDHELPGGTNLTGQIRDVAKSLLRGVWNFVAIPNQNDWYPNPADPKTGGKDFNVYNLDPYVWFVHDVENTAGYAFSVDDDVSNPSAPGPVTLEDGTFNHAPSNLQIAVGGIGGLTNQNEWFPTIRWGEKMTTATITQIPATEKQYPNHYMITLTDPSNGTNPLLNPNRIWNQVFNPGAGELGAYVSNSTYLKPGTTLIFKGPNGNLTSFVLSQAPLKLPPQGVSVPVDIYAGKLRP